MQWMQVSQKGKRGHGDGVDEGGSHLEPDDLMGLTVSQHVSLRVSTTLVSVPILVAPPCSCLLLHMSSVLTLTDHRLCLAKIDWKLAMLHSPDVACAKLVYLHACDVCLLFSSAACPSARQSWTG